MNKLSFALISLWLIWIDFLEMVMAKFIRLMMVVLVCLVGWWLWKTSQSTTTPTQTPPQQPKSHTPIVYDVNEFDNSAPTLAKNQGAWLTHLGATATSETALDMNGEQASLYRYHNKNEPVLYVIDSDSFFEMVWYYPTALDTDKDKATANAYAKRTYAIAKSALGNQAFDFYDNLLNSKQPTLPKGVALAECGDYLCKAVFEKNKVF